MSAIEHLGRMRTVERIARAKMPPGWEPDMFNAREIVGGVLVAGTYPARDRGGRPAACVVCEHEMERKK